MVQRAGNVALVELALLLWVGKSVFASEKGASVGSVCAGWWDLVVLRDGNAKPFPFDFMSVATGRFESTMAGTFISTPNSVDRLYLVFVLHKELVIF